MKLWMFLFSNIFGSMGLEAILIKLRKILTGLPSYDRAIICLERNFYALRRAPHALHGRVNAHSAETRLKSSRLFSSKYYYYIYALVSRIDAPPHEMVRGGPDPEERLGMKPSSEVSITLQKA